MIRSKYSHLGALAPCSNLSFTYRPTEVPCAEPSCTRQGCFVLRHDTHHSLRAFEQMRFLAIVELVALVAGVEGSRQVANNLPNEPGNENFPPEPDAVETVELEKALPVINIKYKWPASTFDFQAKLRGVQESAAFKRRIQNALDAVEQDEKDLLDVARLAKEQIEALTVLGTKKSVQLGEVTESDVRIGNRKGASFLATKMEWAEGQKIRDSLYLTQLMRSPAQASVNVLVHEDPFQLGAHAKYKAMESAASYLKSHVDAGVVALETGK
jgi:hypothetical protein